MTWLVLEVLAGAVALTVLAIAVGKALAQVGAPYPDAYDHDDFADSDEDGITGEDSDADLQEAIGRHPAGRHAATGRVLFLPSQRGPRDRR